MTDQERLEEIQQSWHESCGDVRLLDPENVDWLINTVKDQQTKMKMMEQAIEDDQEVKERLNILAEERQKEIERLREALEFYTDENKYEFETIVSDCDIEVESKILEDGGEKAREALKE